VGSRSLLFGPLRRSLQAGATPTHVADAPSSLAVIHRVDCSARCINGSVNRSFVTPPRRSKPTTISSDAIDAPGRPPNPAGAFFSCCSNAPSLGTPPGGLDSNATKTSSASRFTAGASNYVAEVRAAAPAPRGRSLEFRGSNSTKRVSVVRPFYGAFLVGRLTLISASMLRHTASRRRVRPLWPVQ